MLDVAFYLVSEDIAQRSGLIGERYITKDGRYILDNKDLSRVRFTTDEYISGLSGVEKITNEQAKELIKENGYLMLKPVIEEETSEQVSEEEPVAEENVDNSEEAVDEEENNETKEEEE